MTVPAAIAAPVPPDPAWIDDVVVRRAVALALGEATPAPGRPLTSAEVTSAVAVMARRGCPAKTIDRARVAWRIEQRRYCARCGTDFLVVAVQRQRVDSGLFECAPCGGAQ